MNIRDNKAQAEAFERNFNLGYPSILDTDGSVLMAVSTFVPLRSAPNTLVLAEV